MQGLNINVVSGNRRYLRPMKLSLPVHSLTHKMTISLLAEETSSDRVLVMLIRELPDVFIGAVSRERSQR